MGPMSMNAKTVSVSRSFILQGFGLGISSVQSSSPRSDAVGEWIRDHARRDLAWD
jgi:hypothetical protein